MPLKQVAVAYQNVVGNLFIMIIQGHLFLIYDLVIQEVHDGVVVLAEFGIQSLELLNQALNHKTVSMGQFLLNLQGIDMILQVSNWDYM